MREELKNYTHIVLIHTGACDPAPLRQRAMENAAFFGKRYEEIPGSSDYFAKILRGPYTAKDFFVFDPGREVSREVFLV